MDGRRDRRRHRGRADLTLTAGVSRSAAGASLAEATGRTFDAGTLLAIRRVAEQVGVRRGIDALLFDR